MCSIKQWSCHSEGDKLNLHESTKISKNMLIKVIEIKIAYKLMFKNGTKQFHIFIYDKVYWQILNTNPP